MHIIYYLTYFYWQKKSHCLLVLYNHPLLYTPSNYEINLIIIFFSFITHTTNSQINPTYSFHIHFSNSLYVFHSYIGYFQTGLLAANFFSTVQITQSFFCFSCLRDIPEMSVGHWFLLEGLFRPLQLSHQLLSAKKKLTRTSADNEPHSDDIGQLNVYLPDFKSK